MSLDPQAQFILDQFNAQPLPPLSELGHQAYRQAVASMQIPAPETPYVESQDYKVPGPEGELRIRVYQTVGALPGPAVLFFHGGGFVVGDLESHEGMCRYLAQQSELRVVAVEYRLAPESPFPAAPEDCYAATCWVRNNAEMLGIDPDRLAVAGDSAGANLAIAVCRLAHARRGPELKYQLLLYPVTRCGFDTPSYRENAKGYMLTQEMMRWFWEQYLPSEADADNPLASPSCAEDLGTLPASMVITAGYDPLRDEGEAFAERLANAGVEVELIRFDGMFHGFASMLLSLDAARDAIKQGARALHQALVSGDN